MVKEHAYRPKRQHKPMQKKRFFSPGMMVGIFLGMLMVGSMFGFIASYTSGGDQNALVYNGFKFTQTRYGYATEVEGTQFEFSYAPQSVEYINISKDIINALSSANAVVITYDDESMINQSGALVQFNLGQLYEEVLGAYVTRALVNNSRFDTMEQADCDSATQFVPVIKIVQGETTSVTRQGDCFIMSALNDLDMIRLQDRLSYGLVGVIKDV